MLEELLKRGRRSQFSDHQRYVCNTCKLKLKREIMSIVMKLKIYYVLFIQ